MRDFVLAPILGSAEVSLYNMVLLVASADPFSRDSRRARRPGQQRATTGCPGLVQGSDQVAGQSQLPALSHPPLPPPGHHTPPTLTAPGLQAGYHQTQQHTAMSSHNQPSRHDTSLAPLLTQSLHNHTTPRQGSPTTYHSTYRQQSFAVRHDTTLPRWHHDMPHSAHNGR